VGIGCDLKAPTRNPERVLVSLAFFRDRAAAEFTENFANSPHNGLGGEGRVNCRCGSEFREHGLLGFMVRFGRSHCLLEEVFERGF
jgi:hypothetical protein